MPCWPTTVLRGSRRQEDCDGQDRRGAGDPDGIAVSTTGRLVTVWAGMEWTDLEPEAAERLAALLVGAAELARGA